MKKLTIVLSITVNVVLINAQKVQQKNVPTLVQSALQKQFPDAKNVKWEKEHGNYEAGFQSKGIKYSVLVNSSGTLLETEIPVAINSFPAQSKAFILKKYPNQKIKETSKITDSKGVVTYEAEVNGKDVIFDTKGNFLKETKD